MPLIHKPAVVFPENLLTLEQTIQLGRKIYAGHPKLPLVERLITSALVQKRHLVLPVEEIIDHPGLEARNAIYEEQAKRRLPEVVTKALDNAGMQPSDIDVTILVSCTGFLMPSLTAWMISDLGFRENMKQIPIAQLGCAAGGSAIGLAHDLCRSGRQSNILIISCEFCSLCYQPSDTNVGAMLSAGLFGDAMAAVVISANDDGRGFRLEHSGSHVIPGTETWISYTVKETGFHFNLDKRVPSTLRKNLGPAIEAFTEAHGWKGNELDFYVVHAGGPRIVDAVREYFQIEEFRFRHTLGTLVDCGNIASATVFESLRRLYDEGAGERGSRALIAGFGPGITAEYSLATWVE